MRRNGGAIASRVRTAVGAVAVAGLATAAIAAPSANAQGTIPKEKISFQLYNFLIPVFGAFPLGDGTFFPPGGTPNSPEQQKTAVLNVFSQMAANGYKSFENFNGTFGWTNAEYREKYESRGLHAVADHGAVDEGTWDARLTQAQELGLKYVGSGGWPAGTNMNTVEGAQNMGAVLNRLGTKARAKNLWVYGHNHDAEFSTKLQYDTNGDGVKETVPALEVVILNTDPSLVTFEIDVHWLLEGLKYDQDAAVAFIRKYSKRISMLHVKGSDPTKNPQTIPSTDMSRVTDAGGPTDVTDWKRIFEAAADVDYYHWEYDLGAGPVRVLEDRVQPDEHAGVRQGPRRDRHRGRHRPGDALADAGRARHVRHVRPGCPERLLGPDHGHGHLDRRRRDARGHRSRPPDQRRVQPR